MSDGPALTIAYLEHAPRSAGEVLQSLEIHEAAAFLDAVPARLSAPVMNSMIPWTAARCLARLSAPRAAAIVRALSFQDAASLLRLVPEAGRAPIFEELPASLARRFESSLSYPLSQVGAWIDFDVPALRTSDTARDAKRLLHESRVTASHVFVESEEDGTFVGVLSMNDLLRGADDERLARLELARIAPVSNRASLTSVTFDERWDDFLYLPVVGRRRAILGGLSRAALRKGIHEYHTHERRAGTSAMGALLGAFFVCVTGLFHLVVPAGNVERPTATGGSRRGQ